ncbi:phenazine biosynthesis protein PhzF family [Quadrisphaera granulorum]|uniref:PhzF family phenazine biosynthesis protein n=1 Tax=Quadrisphaera granulorum TaxID=317664 RepID=A0A315ZN51_9ACTN|nr:PhzF family phenazine biosynthesis protein [Quadrisphaera granulorum]PWJ47055.1 PhzF family phenazine biosynthesis protein [Quadrisphaera granulorum]SZE98956.1 phenazine biosynthesis protein PhzF family [Quadrisphaera granulorum]
MSRRFTQVDVFTRELTRGNAVAVVHDADDLDDDAMRAFARWTQLSETTFLLAPTPEGAAAGADYRVRIFTPGSELPFAGHPTLGSARAWLEAGGVPQREGVVVQECGAGLVAVRRSVAQDDDGDGDEVLAFEAPPLRRSGPVDPADLAAAAASVGVRTEDVVDAAWVDNGPGWVALLLTDAAAVLAASTSTASGEGGRADGPSAIGVIGPYRDGTGPGGAAVEVRAFFREFGTWGEDSVTGSLNAGLGQWLTAGGAGAVLPARYTASQGAALGRSGHVHVAREGDGVWVGGATVVGVSGSVAL